MLNKYKLVVGAVLVAASQMAAADMAEVKVSDVTLSVSGGEWWYWLPTNVDWLSQTAGTSATLQSPSFADSASGWHGDPLSSSVVDGASSSLASLTAKTSGDLNGVSALAKVDVSNGQAGSSFAKVFDGQIMVGGNATITVSMKLDSILANGAMSQANAWIELCSTDFTTDTCLPANFTEAVVFGDAAYSGPATLTASWTNPGATTWAKMHIGLTASAESLAAPVPEPSAYALWLAGLAGVGAIARRRRQH